MWRMLIEEQQKQPATPATTDVGEASLEPPATSDVGESSLEPPAGNHPPAGKEPPGGEW